MAAQSPGKVPTADDPAAIRQGENYLQAWEAVGRLLESGRSWSGHEQNCAFLNLSNGVFSPCAGAAGLNLDADSRAVAATDWDRDGDLDLWFTHRTGPRVSFHANQTPGDDRSISLQLEGAKSNRDAIGARVEIALEGYSRPLIRTLRAGEGYLSQSSKTLVIGLPGKGKIAGLTVKWPAGTSETFSGLQRGFRYRLVEGSGKATAMPRGRQMSGPEKITSPPPTEVPDNPVARIVPHAPLPLPALPYFGKDGSTISLIDRRRPVFVTLWASWCEPCLRELAVFSDAEDAWRKAQLDVLCLNIERAQGETSSATKGRGAPKLPAAFQTGEATAASLEQLEVVQRSVMARESGLALPSSFLLDSRGRLLVIYRGPVSPDRVLSDLTLLTRRPESQHRDAAVPFAGAWLMSGPPTDLLAIPIALLEVARPQDAFHYLERHVTRGEHPAKQRELPFVALTRDAVAELYFSIGDSFKRTGNPDFMERTWERAVAYTPSALERRSLLAIHYETTKQWAAAAEHYRAILAQAPDHLAARNSLAWILATAPVPELRDTDEAIRLAYAVCQATDMNQPEPLDTLAGALAAAGRFKEAIHAAERGRALAKRANRPEIVRALERRLALYRKNRPFVQTAP